MRRWRNTHANGPAPQPPVPVDPTVCRWCGATRTTSVLSPEIPVCPTGCRTVASPLAHRCEDCAREFHTGRRFDVGVPRLCWLCEAQDAARFAGRERHEGGAPRGFLKDEISRGASRRAHAAGKDA